MDNAQKAIMIGVSLFITIIVISAVLVIVQLGQGLTDAGTENVSSIASTLQNSILQNYDNKVVSGALVRSALTNYMTSDSVSVVLASKEGNLVAGVGNWDLSKCTIKLGDGMAEIDSTEWDKKVSATIKSITSFTNVDRNEETFVNSSKQYESYVIYRNDVDAMVGILFIPYGHTVTAVDGAKTLTPAT